MKAPTHKSFPRPARQRRWLQTLLTATALATLASGLAQTPSLVPNHATYYPGEDITFSFQNGPGNRLDWVGIYPEGVEPGSVGSTLWYYVDNTRQGNVGLTEGTVVFAGGLNLAGPWTSYLLLNDGYGKLAQTAFTVVDPFTPLVRTDQPVYTAGQPITLTFTNGPANAKDWIGIYKAGETPGGGPNSTLWNYVDGTQTGSTGLADGAMTFPQGLAAAGSYVAFFLQNDAYDVLASEPFTVVTAASTHPRVLSVRPANGTQNQPPQVTYTATITNGTTKVVPGSVTLTLNGTVVTHQYSELNDLVTVTHTPSNLLPAGSTNTFTLLFGDNGTPPNEVTNDTTFVVGAWRDIVLPAPLYFENFDATPEGQLPAGWTDISYTDVQNPEFDLGNLDSASYAEWVVVNAERFNGPFVTYSTPDSQDTDYQRVLSVNPLNVVNGQVYNQPLASGRFAFGNSGYRNGASQVVYLFSPDVNLTGKTNIHLSFHSLWEQNQDSLGAVEYSVDQGRNWLPVAYYLDGPDIVTTTAETTGAVSVDAVATFTTERGDIARYTDPETFEDKGGMYGAFIGATISQDLAPFIEARTDNDDVGSKRIELYRLPQADDQGTVRIRFAHAGTDSWYFGLDNVGLFSIPSGPTPPPALTVTRSGNSLTISWPAEAAGFALESSPAVAPGSWTPVPGVTGNSVTITATENERFYRLRR